MTGKIFVHIGLPKTATTTLQKEVFPALADEKVCYLGVVQPRQADQQDELYARICRAVNSGTDLSETRKALLTKTASGTTIILSEEMFTVSSRGTAWRAKLNNLAVLLQGLDYVLIVTVREPAAALFSYYVELHERFVRSKKSFLELAKADESMEIFHYEKLSEALLQHFSRDRIFIQTFEDIVSGRLETLCRLVSDGKQGWQAAELRKHNDKKQTNGRIYTGKSFTLADVPRRLSQTLGITETSFANKLKTTLRPIVRAMDKVAFAKKTVRKPSEQEFVDLRSFLKEETAALERHFGITYE